MKRNMFSKIFILLLLVGILCMEVSANSPPSQLRDPGEMTSGDLVFYFILAACGAVFTIVTEVLAMRVLGKRNNYQKLVVVTNLVSQLLMHALYLSLYSVFYKQFVYVVIVLELLVYAGEFLIYRWKMKSISTGRILIYTVIANTLSLLVGIGMILLLSN